MKVISLSSILVWAALLNCLLFSGPAFAGFLGFGSDEGGKSGLDLSSGYDVNTVGTVVGRVHSPPRLVEESQYVVEVDNGAGKVSVSLGPKTFWEKRGIEIRPNDEISAKGARAQGKDGRSYLLTQKLVNRSTGAELELRSEKGEPAWQGRSAYRAGLTGSQAGQRFQGGGFMRGGGGMMGWGMMRR